MNFSSVGKNTWNAQSIFVISVNKVGSEQILIVGLQK